jgi:spermidine/putrescine transport system substrate-binding protein
LNGTPLPESVAGLLRYENKARRAALNRTLTRRSLLLAAGGGLLSACGVQGTASTVPSSEAVGYSGADYSDSEKIVDFSNWPAYIDVNSSNQSDHPTLDAFTKRTGIKVAYNEEINDNNDFYTKIDPMLVAKKDTGRDIIVLSDFMIPKLRELNYIQELDAANVPNRSNMIKSALNDPIDPGRRFTMPWAYGFTTIAYNTDLVKEPITSFAELFTRSDLKGKVTLFSEMEDTVAIALLILGRSPADFTDADFDAALSYIQKAKNAGQIRQFKGNDYLSDFQLGNTAATMAYSGDVAQLGKPNLKTVDLPTEGLLSWSDNMCIPNYARHKKNAEKLMNYYYEPSVAAQLDDYIDYIPVVTAAIGALRQLDPGTASNPLIVPTDAMLAKAVGFRSLSIAKLDSYTTKFQQITGQ